MAEKKTSKTELIDNILETYDPSISDKKLLVLQTLKSRFYFEQLLRKIIFLIIILIVFLAMVSFVVVFYTWVRDTLGEFSKVLSVVIVTFGGILAGYIYSLFKSYKLELEIKKMHQVDKELFSQIKLDIIDKFKKVN